MDAPAPAASPGYSIWELTRACNLRCRHCGAAAGRRLPDELTLAEWHGVAAAFARLGTRAVCLMGGELLVRRDWPAVAGRLRELGLEVGLVTNGWLLDDATLRRSLDLGLNQLGTSLDGTAPVHDAIRGRAGAHARAERAVRAIAASGVRYPMVITSVSRANLGELPALRDWLAASAAGVTWVVNTSTCHEAGRLPADDMLDAEGFLALARFLDDARRQLRGVLEVSPAHDVGYFSRRLPDLAAYPWRGCPAGVDTMQVQADGGIKGCLAMDDAFREGNVRTHDLEALWRDPGAFAYNRRFRLEDLRGACAGCEHGRLCRGGCSDLAHAHTGHLHEHPFCLCRGEGERRPA